MSTRIVLDINEKWEKEPPKGLSECRVKYSMSDGSLNSKSILLSLGNCFHQIMSTHKRKYPVLLSLTGVTCCFIICRIRFIDITFFANKKRSDFWKSQIRFHLKKSGVKMEFKLMELLPLCPLLLYSFLQEVYFLELLLLGIFRQWNKYFFLFVFDFLDWS